MFKFTNRAKVLTLVLMMVYLFATTAAPTWYTATFHAVDWISPVYAQSNIRNFAFAPLNTTGAIIARGSTTQEFYVTSYGITVATGLTTASAFSFVYGDTSTAQTCASNQVSITETFVVASGVTQFNKEMSPSGNPIIRVPRGHELCIVANAPAVNVDGFVSGYYQSE